MALIKLQYILGWSSTFLTSSSYIHIWWWAPAVPCTAIFWARVHCFINSRDNSDWWATRGHNYVSSPPHPFLLNLKLIQVIRPTFPTLKGQGHDITTGFKLWFDRSRLEKMACQSFKKFSNVLLLLYWNNKFFAAWQPFWKVAGSRWHAFNRVLFKPGKCVEEQDERYCKWKEKSGAYTRGHQKLWKIWKLYCWAVENL